MSLISQMLKDLDARHDADARARLHREVRPLPAGDDNPGPAPCCRRIARARLAVVGLVGLSAVARRAPPTRARGGDSGGTGRAGGSIGGACRATAPAADAVATAAVSATAAEQSPVAEAMMPEQAD